MSDFFGLATVGFPFVRLSSETKSPPKKRMDMIYLGNSPEPLVKMQKIMLGVGETLKHHVLFPASRVSCVFLEAEAVQVKRMTESNMRQQYMEHGFSKLTVPSYGDVGEEAFGKVGRFLVTWRRKDFLSLRCTKSCHCFV